MKSIFYILDENDNKIIFGKISQKEGNYFYAGEMNLEEYEWSFDSNIKKNSAIDIETLINFCFVASNIEAVPINKKQIYFKIPNFIFDNISNIDYTIEDFEKDFEPFKSKGYGYINKSVIKEIDKKLKKIQEFKKKINSNDSFINFGY